MKGEIARSNGKVAIRIKEIIDEKGLKQVAVAKKAGLSEYQLSSMIAGRKIIRVADIEAIMAVLEVDANTLFGQGEF